MADSETDLASGALFGEPAAVPYRVLARKYRPHSFDDLIGQDPMVQTLSNAFAAGRIAQAFMLTGVRGVGKTTTARILARGLNYDTGNGEDQPRIDMPDNGRHCQQIMEGSHVDVLEMDAASHTSIDDIREIIEAVRYRPVSARYKVYIIDEVHMLSKAAFNGLLKTLEEPPPHVKFIFATTEIRKVPVTVLSRCQRFDLRRVAPPALTDHLAKICEAEKVSVEPPALMALARASEGSVRDALSLLDQAIAHQPDKITEEGVRQMLGLADRATVHRLFEAIVAGQTAEALSLLQGQYALGVEPAQVVADLAAFNHLVTRLKFAAGSDLDDSLSPDEQQRGGALAAQLSVRFLSRNWQMTVKGLQEIQQSPNAMQAADMVIIRLCHAADLPHLDELTKQVQGQQSNDSAPPPNQPTGPARSAAPQARRSQAQAVPQTPPQVIAASQPDGPRAEFRTLPAILELAKAQRDIGLCYIIEHHVRLVKLEPGKLTINLEPGHPPDAVTKLSQRLQQWSGERWMVALSKEPGEAPLAEQAARAKDRLKSDARLDPLVAGVLEQFPGATVVDVRIHAADEPAVVPVDEDDDDALGGDID